MKICTLLTGACLLSFSLSAQVLKPSKTEALIILHVKSSTGTIRAYEPILFTSKSTKIKYKSTTSHKGEAEVLLPRNDSFSVSFTNAPDYFSFDTPDKANFTMKLGIIYDGVKEIKDESSSKIGDTIYFDGSKPQNLHSNIHLVKIQFDLKDYRGLPLDSEVISIYGTSTKRYYKGITGKYGKVQMLIPKGDLYKLSFKYDKDIDELNYPVDQGDRSAIIEYIYEGSKNIETRKKKLEEDLAKAKKAQEEAEKLSMEERKKELSDRVDGKNRTDDTVVSAVLNRNRQWKNKLIVADLTGSMSPYAAEIGLWFKMNAEKEKNLNAVFFNDGDNKTQEEKKLGETGGIYTCKECGKEKLLETMVNTIKGGSGGDGPENDIEALIKGIKLFPQSTDVVLVADNNCTARDIALLSQVKVPVHVILCGMRGGIGLEYLYIAWKTGGSIHTIEQDIWDMAKLTEGSEIKIGSQTYKIVKGQFIPLKRA